MKCLVVILLCTCALGLPVQEDLVTPAGDIIQKVLEANPQDNDILHEEEPVTQNSKEAEKNPTKNESQIDLEGNVTEQTQENESVTESVTQVMEVLPVNDAVNEKEEKESSLKSKLVEEGKYLFDEILSEVKKESYPETKNESNTTQIIDEEELNKYDPEVEYTKHVNEPIVPTAEVGDIIPNPFIEAFESQPAVELIKPEVNDSPSSIDNYDIENDENLPVEETLDERFQHESESEPLVELPANEPVLQDDIKIITSGSELHSFDNEDQNQQNEPNFDEHYYPTDGVVPDIQNNADEIMPNDRIDETDPITDFTNNDETIPVEELTMSQHDSMSDELTPENMDGEFHRDVIDTPDEEIQAFYNNSPLDNPIVSPMDTLPIEPSIFDHVNMEEASDNPIVPPMDTLPLEPSIFDHVNMEEASENSPPETPSFVEHEEMLPSEEDSFFNQPLQIDETNIPEIVPHDNLEGFPIEPVMSDEKPDHIMTSDSLPEDENPIEHQFQDMPLTDNSEMSQHYIGEINDDAVNMESLMDDISKEPTEHETYQPDAIDHSDYSYIDDSSEPETFRNGQVEESLDYSYEPTIREENIPVHPAESVFSRMSSSNFGPYYNGPVGMEENGDEDFIESNNGEENYYPYAEQDSHKISNDNFENLRAQMKLRKFLKQTEADFFSHEPITEDKNFMKKSNNNYMTKNVNEDSKRQHPKLMLMNNQHGFEMMHQTPSIEIPVANNNPVGEIVIDISGTNAADNFVMLKKDMSNHEKRQVAKNDLKMVPMAEINPFTYMMPVPGMSSSTQDKNVYTYIIDDRHVLPKRLSEQFSSFSYPRISNIFSGNWPVDKNYNVDTMMKGQELYPTTHGIIFVQDAGVLSNHEEQPLQKFVSKLMSENDVKHSPMKKFKHKKNKETPTNPIIIDDSGSLGISLNKYPFDTDKSYAPAYHHQNDNMQPNMNNYYPHNFYPKKHHGNSYYGPFQANNGYEHYLTNNHRNHQQYYNNDDINSFQANFYDSLNNRRGEGFMYNNYNDQMYPSTYDEHFYRLFNRRNKYDNMSSFRPFPFY